MDVPVDEVRWFLRMEIDRRSRLRVARHAQAHQHLDERIERAVAQNGDSGETTPGTPTVHSAT
jgi:hypothetical protein